MNEQVAQPAESRHNITLTGDDCRFLIHMLTNGDARIPGPFALRVGELLRIFNEISNVQPPQGQQFPARG